MWTRTAGWLQTTPPALSSFTFPFAQARLTADGGFAVGPVPGVHRLGATGFAPVPFRVNPGITALAVDDDDAVYGVGAAGAILRRAPPSP